MQPLLCSRWSNPIGPGNPDERILNLGCVDHKYPFENWSQCFDHHCVASNRVALAWIHRYSLPRPNRLAKGTGKETLLTGRILRRPLTRCRFSRDAAAFAIDLVKRGICFKSEQLPQINGRQIYSATLSPRLFIHENCWLIVAITFRKGAGWERLTRRSWMNRKRTDLNAFQRRS